MAWRPVVSSINRLIVGGFIPHTDVTEEGILFSTAVPEGAEASVLLYEKGCSEVRLEIPFPDHSMVGRIAGMLVSGVPADEIEYNFRIGGKIVTDRAAQCVAGLECYGAGAGQGGPIRGGFISKDYDWEEDTEPLRIPYRDSVFYELHVRGFTGSYSSRVRHRGTFKGTAEKVPYLRSMGITAVVLMPCYEFEEVLPDYTQGGWRPEGLQSLADGSALPQAGRETRERDSVPGDRRTDPPRRLNFWGFGPGWCFAPKRSYCATDNPGNEFRDMVKAFHRAGMEIIMEMDFSRCNDPEYMQAALLWWRAMYHVDGFLLMADRGDLAFIGRSAALSDCKMISEYFPADRMFPEGRPYPYRNLAECNFGFRIDARKILKGDGGALQPFTERVRRNPKDEAVVNAVTDHDGFTLLDLVSYNNCHNEENGGAGPDGASSEFSWNCGAEGPSRKKNVQKLRMRQIRNAFCLMMLSQGTPMLRAGDECLNSQGGSSNPWCLDSELSYVSWSSSKRAKSIRSFVKRLIAFRRDHHLLHQEAELTGSSMGGPFPQLSFHGVNAWFASFDQEDRSVGLMYSGWDRSLEEGGSRDDSCPECYLYVAYNFHWESRQLALPFLPAGRRWRLVIDTSSEDGFIGSEKETDGQQNESCGAAPCRLSAEAEAERRRDRTERESADVKSITVPGRTIWVLEG